jgi:hypothetical protein
VKSIVVALLALLPTAVPVAAQEPKPTVEVRAEYLMTLEAPIDLPQRVGARTIVNVRAGGWVRGPRITGSIVAPSGDWLHVMPDGSSRLDVRLTIKTDDDQLIFVEYGGVLVFSEDAAARLARGDLLTHADAHFLTAPRFTTASEKYAWLNHVQAVGKMVSVQRGHHVKYDIFELR